jgi:AcrR family transcriptional regulator
MSSGKRGPKPAGTDTRDAIIEAARKQFSEKGYQGTTLRNVGAAAGVDPRLILHYFGSKQQLFVQSLELPIDPEMVLERLFAPGPGTIGERAAETIVAVLEDKTSRRVMVSVIRAAASEPEAAELIREMLTTSFLLPVAERVGGSNPQLRATLAASQIVGLGMARHVVGLAPLAGASREQLVRAVAPVFDHYLTGDFVIAEEAEAKPSQ